MVNGQGFFGFCESQGWISDSPARKLKPLNFKKGNRTAIFTDKQYVAILEAVSLCDPENVPEATRKAWQQRLQTFVELLRFSGMDLIDAVRFRPESIDAEGVLRYRRQKTDVLATVQLPARVIALLHHVPLERDSVGQDRPFRQKDVKPQSDTATWARRLETLFKLAEIKEVRTGIGQTKKPHAKMFRDTFAVNKLSNGASVYAVSKMLGHSKVTTTEQAYLPWVKELETRTIEEGRKALKSEIPQATTRQKVVKIRHPKL
jgi:integrase